MITFIFIFYTIALCYFDFRIHQVKKQHSIKWNGSKYIVRSKKRGEKGRIKLQAKGRINGLFDIIKLGETL